MNGEIVFVGTLYNSIPPKEGGSTEIWIYEVSRRLAHRGIKVGILSPFGKTKELQNIPYAFFYSLPSGWLNERCRKLFGFEFFPYIKRCIKILKKHRPIIFHLSGIKSNQWVVYLKRAFPNTKIVLHIHSDLRKELHKWKLKDISLVDVYAGCSKYVSSILVKALSIPYNKTYVLYNGIDIFSWKNIFSHSQIRKKVRKSLNISSIDIVVLCCCADIVPIKGILESIESVKILIKKGYNIKLVIVGNIPFDHKNEEYREYIKKVFKSSQDYSKNIIFTGKISRKHLNNYYLCADIFLSLFLSEEGWGRVNIEAMLTGLPVVTTDKGGVKEYIENGKNGIIAKDPRDINDIAKKLENLILSSQKRYKLGQEAMEYVKKHFSWDKITQSTLELYQKLYPIL